MYCIGRECVLFIMGLQLYLCRFLFSSNPLYIVGPRSDSTCNASPECNSVYDVSRPTANEGNTQSDVMYMNAGSA